MIRQKKPQTDKKMGKIENWKVPEMEYSNEWGIKTHSEILTWDTHEIQQEEPQD